MNHFQSLKVVLWRLKCCWLPLVVIGAVFVVGGFTWRNCPVGELLIYAGYTVVGAACSHLFSRQDQFLLRGSGDSVYLVQNNFLCPHVYQFANRKTLDAFGGVWHEISHVSERMTMLLSRFFGKGQLCLVQADLYQVTGGETTFAVLLGTRYGIPDRETRESIWKDRRPVPVGVSDLDKWRPGRDLVSIHYWPEKDRAA